MMGVDVEEVALDEDEDDEDDGFAEALTMRPLALAAAPAAPAPALLVVFLTGVFAEVALPIAEEVANSMKASRSEESMKRSSPPSHTVASSFVSEAIQLMILFLPLPVG